ncbi:MAG TPA: DUF427 domain-containing protein [Acidimicrobiia bacterium]|nr:DUF427 domain-containing protein [Acidimicrobiia bacterium]
MTWSRARPTPDPTGPGQESVWGYPRPPRVEPVGRALRVVLDGTVVATTTHGFRVLETSHPPNYYFPPDSVTPGALVRTVGGSWCEYKGAAHYFDVHAGARVARDAAWGYDNPSPGYEAIRGYVAFYPGRVDSCFVDDELVVPQPGGFYGGWITSDVAGPFKGAAGTLGW